VFEGESLQARSKGGAPKTQKLLKTSKKYTWILLIKQVLQNQNTTTYTTHNFNVKFKYTEKTVWWTSTTAPNGEQTNQLVSQPENVVILDIRNKKFVASTMKDVFEQVKMRNVIIFIKETNFYNLL